MVEWVKKFGPAKKISVFFLFFLGGGSFFCGWGSKSLDLNIATNKRYGDSRLVAKSPFSKKATVYLATVTIATVANYTLPIMMVVVVVMVTMMRRTVAVMMRMNLVPRDSDGRVIHDAASVEVDHHHHCHHYHHHQHHHHTFCATKICKNNVIAITAKG